MVRALIVHASRHGATSGIAERIGDVLRAEGIDAVVAPASQDPDPQAFDACIVGGGVYMGSWVKDGTDYLERYQFALARMPVWLFSCGPLPGSTKEAKDTDPITQALGPADGPGSGGRKKVEGPAQAIGIRGHAVFQGAYDPKAPPKVMSERLVRTLFANKGILPPGDFRQWDLVVAWADELAAAIKEPVPVG